MLELLTDRGQPLVHSGHTDLDGGLSDGFLYREALDDDEPQHFGSRGISVTIVWVIVRDYHQEVRG